jgi:azurin
MRKYWILPALASVFWMAACGGNSEQSKSESASGTEVSSSTGAAQTVDLSAVPGAEALEFTQEFTIEGNDQMKFDKVLFKVKAGEKVILHFKNVGEMPIESMGHNVVILKPNTDLAQFGGEAMKATQSEYIPMTFRSSIISHTKLLGPGEEETIEFVLEEKGIYPYVCSFPGHYGVMQGKIVAL